LGSPFLTRGILSFLACLLFSLCLPALGAEVSLPRIIKEVEPSSVVVLTYNPEDKLAGQGTGFFINAKGDVITNYHVIQGALRAEVRTSGGEVFPVKRVVADDKAGDLARLSVDTFGAIVRPLRVNTSLPEVGERVVVVGSPLGLEKTVSDGIVSAVREVPHFGKIIQLTAPISQGSSGSPVVNMKGEVVGIISFFVAPGQNLNFAIPGERIAGLVPGEGKSFSEWARISQEDVAAYVLQVYATGIKYMLLEDYDRALAFFTEVLKVNPNHAGAYFQVGYCLGQLGRYEEAIEPYRRAVRLRPEDADTYNNLCVAYNMVGRLSEAVESCTQAIGIRSDLAEAHNNLGWSYHKLGRFQESIESCHRAIRIKPDYALAYYNLGNSYASLGRYPEAIEAYKQTIRYKPDHAESHMNLGAAYNQMGNHESAIESYKQALRIKPDLAEAHLNIGMTYLKLSDRGSALDEYKILMKLDKGLANQLFNLIYE
jgi:tetratricopeptide (TPR) repeat protein